MFPNEDIFVPTPPIKIPEGLLERYVSLYKGLRSKLNPISWRSFITESKAILGCLIPDATPLARDKFPKAKKLVKFLLKGTYMEKLYHEALSSLGVSQRMVREDLDLLIVNAHHSSEPLFWGLIEEAKKEKLNFAGINPVGHYSDQQIRILSPLAKYFTAKKILIITSTQGAYGGGVTLLVNVLRILRNEMLTRKTQDIDIVIPMFGGSRGHKINQLPEIGYEVLEMINNPKMLCLMIRDIKRKLALRKIKFPTVKFYSVDIHNEVLPARTFAEYHFPFINILPSKEIAKELFHVIKRKRLAKYPLSVIICDSGAYTRAENLIKAFLKYNSHYSHRVNAINIKKERKQAGVIASAKIDEMTSYLLKNKKIIKKPLTIPKISYGPYTLFYIDDMIDTGGTAKKDMEIVLSKFPNPRMKIFAATHPIFSKGLTPLDTIGADLYLIGNTLKVPGLKEIPKVTIVDVSRSIMEAVK